MIIVLKPNISRKDEGIVVKEIKRLGRSLMFTADMMGLDHQALADIAAYLASDIK